MGTLTGSVYSIGGDGAKLTATTATPGESGGPIATAAAPSATPTATPAPTAVLVPTSVLWTGTSGDPTFQPWGLSVAPNGNLWAVEAIKDRFAIFTPDGMFKEYWGAMGTGNGQFDLTRGNGDPYGMIALEPDGSYFVLDAGNRRIEAFGADRTFIRAWGGFGANPGEFNDPISIAVDAKGNLSVLDDVRAVIETFDRQGKVLKTIPAFPSSATPRSGANQLAIGPNGHFYVSIIGPNEVIEIDGAGALVREYGAGTAFVDQPNAMAFDAKGRLYVAQGVRRGDKPGVVVFASDGTYLGGFGSLGTGDADLGFAWGLVVLPDGIVTSDSGGTAEFGYRSVIRKFGPIAFP